MSVDPLRERDLAALGVTAHVDTDNGVCTVHMTIDAFDHLVTTVVPKPDEPPWYETVRDSLDEAEAALRDVAYEIRRAKRDAEKTRG